MEKQTPHLTLHQRKRHNPPPQNKKVYTQERRIRQEQHTTFFIKRVIVANTPTLSPTIRPFKYFGEDKEKLSRKARDIRKLNDEPQDKILDLKSENCQLKQCLCNKDVEISEIIKKRSKIAEAIKEVENKAVFTSTIKMQDKSRDKAAELKEVVIFGTIKMKSWLKRQGRVANWEG